MPNNKMKTKINLHNVVLKPKYLLVKISTAINKYCKAEEAARKRCILKMTQLLHLEKQGRKSRPQPQPQPVLCRDLSFDYWVVVVVEEEEEEEAINMKQEREEIFEINKDRKKRGSSRDGESSSPVAAAAAEGAGEGDKKSKSSSPFTIPPPSSFLKFISKKTSKLSFSKWSINHDKMMMKTIVNGASCVYLVGEEGEGDIEDPAVWRRRRKKKAGRSSARDEKEGYELCRRRILMGKRCKPLNNSGKLLYDETGILVPEDIYT